MNRCLMFCRLIFCLVLSATAQSKPPNILIIVADDLGYSDIGSFGGEIETPNLDRLAAQGLKLTNFHASPICSATRAMLLTGTDHHVVGLENVYVPGRTARRTKDHLTGLVPTIAQQLQAAGYHTSIAGKWHLGEAEEHSPSARGFERSMVLLGPGANHFNRSDFRPGRVKAGYRQDGQHIQLPETFYSSNFYTNQTLEYLKEAVAQNRPFFSVLAFTAPHAPLQAPRAFIEKYKPVYTQGYVTTFRNRFERMRTLHMLPADFTPLDARMRKLEQAWLNLSPDQQRDAARKMSVYAAMIDYLDDQIGRVMAYLQQHKLEENTLIVFLSDNGAHGIDRTAGSTWQNWFAQEGIDNRYENMGSENSILFLDEYWGNVANTPLHRHKTDTTEGGIRVPAIFSYPALIKAGNVNATFTSVQDIYPTLMELVRLAPKEGLANVQTGVSLMPILQNPAAQLPKRGFGYELAGERAFIESPWKVVQGRIIGPDRWQLFHLVDDPRESQDLAHEHPDEVTRLVQAWQEYAENNGVDIK